MLKKLLVLSLLPATVLAQDYNHAKAGYDFQFPRDHGAHRDFRIEWWYYTGNVETAEGREFGYELTVFRTAMAPPSEWKRPDSPLAAHQLYTGHFAISDIDNEGHAFWERLGRPGLGNAKASTENLDIQLGSWSVVMDDEEAMALLAGDDENKIDLRLIPARPFVIHGNDGVHQKSYKTDQTSHYISFTRLDTTGTITWKGDVYTVTGLSWMDHEFGSDFLADDQTGWDWFALQFEDGRDLMVYQLREEGGSASAQTSGSLVPAEGKHEEIADEDFLIEVTRTWKSPNTGHVYPMGWILKFPSYASTITVEPAFDSQEMVTESTVGVTYWEGAIRFSGTWMGKDVSGKGYVELVGYDKDFDLL